MQVTVYVNVSRHIHYITITSFFQILDLGSGKGYLSQCLALQYGLNVVGVDSSDSNTQNAARRNERLLKVWQGLVKKSQKEKLNSSSNFAERNVTSGHLDSQPQERTLAAGNRNNQNLESLSNCCTCPSCIGISHACNQSDNSIGSSDLNQVCHIDEQKGPCDMCNVRQNVVEAENKLHTVSKAEGKEVDHSKATCTLAADFQSFVPSSEYHDFDSTLLCNRTSYRNVTLSTTCRCRCYNSKTPQSVHAASAMIPVSQSANPTSFVPVTGFVDQSFLASGELTRLFEEQGTSNGVTNGCNGGMFLVGLHTCGDLAPMALRIFVSEPTVKVVCIVGCCYHLVSQEFGSKYKKLM